MKYVHLNCFLPGPGCEHGHVSKGQWDQGDGEESQIVHKPKTVFHVAIIICGLDSRWKRDGKGEGIYQKIEICEDSLRDNINSMCQM